MKILGPMKTAKALSWESDAASSGILPTWDDWRKLCCPLFLKDYPMSKHNDSKNGQTATVGSMTAAKAEHSSTATAVENVPMPSSDRGIIQNDQPTAQPTAPAVETDPLKLCLREFAANGRSKLNGTKCGTYLNVKFEGAAQPDRGAVALAMAEVLVKDVKRGGDEGIHARVARVTLKTQQMSFDLGQGVKFSASRDKTLDMDIVVAGVGEFLTNNPM
jgi:hypothetical protein